MPARNPPWLKDELILALDLYFQFGPGKLSKVSADVLALSKTLNELPLETERPDAPRFRNPNGVYMKLCNFLRFDPDYRGTGLTHGGKQEKAIWEEFISDRSRLHQLAESIRAVTEADGANPQIPSGSEEDHEAPEGRILSRFHSIRERNRDLVSRKKNQAFKRKGRLECEVCGFCYVDGYGGIGEGFIECHHILPLSQIRPNQVTKLSDLATVCANCHRMLHRGG